MLPDIKPGITSSGAGWNCALCGVWVPVNTYHACGGNIEASIAPLAPITMNRDGEIIEKLNEIIGLLKKISRRTIGE